MIAIPMSFLFLFKLHNLSYLIFLTALGVSLFLTQYIFGFFKKRVISRAKHPLPLNLLCNINKLGIPYYFGNKQFDLDEIITDNQLNLTLYYINNPQYPILEFRKNILLFHNREYRWEDLNWRYFLDPTFKIGKSDGKYVIEFEGTDPDNNRLKNKIEFEKVKAKENEVILLFIIHDLLFGKRSSYYY
ncbi:hypothetical protein [Chryseobacterium sp. Mn2064]|uniref:hypothetical protein n=1 Tax=Chryseobacterium sp. Mn2064 TaxID=3395263 RepID=UPI003BDD43DF